ncbi:histone-lysine N-methyltransferase SETMAR [Trichonephila clavipes]|nr:histone-lysine N-methyltransferase SETMAR [Trichonephila clavipes]
MQNHIATLGWEPLYHPQYSPDHPPSDFHLFSALQKKLTGMRCRSNAGVKQVVKLFFRMQASQFFLEGFLELIKWTATAGSDVVQSGRPIFDDFFQHLRSYIGNNTANVIFQMVKRANASQVAEIVYAVYGSDTVKARYVQFWFRRFRSGIFDVKDAPRTGRAVFENFDEITEIIEVDQHIGSRSTTQELKIDHKTVLNHLRKVGFKKKLRV